MIKLFVVKPGDKLKPLPKTVINDMKDIIARIKKGQYRHDQGDWHCGTSHCFGGWKHLRDYVKENREYIVDHPVAFDIDNGIPKDPKALSSLVCTFGDGPLLHWTKEVMEKAYGKFGRNNADPAAYATAAWGLTMYETTALFQGTNTIEDLEIAVSLLEKGLRKIRSGRLLSSYVDPSNKGTTLPYRSLFNPWQVVVVPSPPTLMDDGNDKTP